MNVFSDAVDSSLFVSSIKSIVLFQSYIALLILIITEIRVVRCHINYVTLYLSFQSDRVCFIYLDDLIVSS